MPGAVDVRVEQVEGLRYLRITPDRNRLARYGLTVDDVNQLTETLAVGHLVGDVLEGERRFGIVVKAAYPFTGDLEPMRALPLRSVSGQVVPLGDVAEVAFLTGPAQVSREALSRRLAVEFNVRDRDLLSVVREAQAAGGRGAPAGRLSSRVGRAVSPLPRSAGEARGGGAAGAVADSVSALAHLRFGARARR